MLRETEKRRTAALAEHIRRKISGPDLSRLDDEQREWYTEWQRKKSEYVAMLKGPGAYYAAILQPDYVDPLPLRADISNALNGEFTINVDDTNDDAVEKYSRLLKR